jgi:CheY-like chemotaxis protein
MRKPPGRWAARLLGDVQERIVRTTATRVLIIDDDPLIRTLLVSALRKECFVAVAADGAEGFAKALELKPDVAVIDVNMPGWDGLKTLEAFRGHATLRAIKIIMLTADASKQTVMAAVRAGANDYLIKTSFSKSDFYRKLNLLVPGTINESPLLRESRGAALNHVAAIAGSARAALFSSTQDNRSSTQESWSGPHCRDASPAAGQDSALAAASQNDPAVEAQLQVMIDGWE